MVRGLLERLLGAAVTVDAPEHLARPVVLRRWWGAAPTFEHLDGTPLPRDRWENWVAERPHGGRALLEAEFQWSQLAPAVRVDGALVTVGRPLARSERTVLVLCLVGSWTGGALGAGLGTLAVLVSARILRDARPLDRRRLRAAVPLLLAAAVVVAVALLVRSLR